MRYHFFHIFHAPNTTVRSKTSIIFLLQVMLFEVNARCYIMSIDMDDISFILEFLQDDISAGYSSSSEGELGEDTSSPQQSNKYLWELEQSCSLKILQIEKVRKAYDKKHALGLFHLFLSKLWFKTLHRWCCKGMESKGRKKNTFDQFMAYIGLEMAMSLVPLNSIKDYWSSEMFLRQADFKAVMGRNDFQNIHSCVFL